MFFAWPRKHQYVIPDRLPQTIVVTCVNGGYAQSGMLRNWVGYLTALGLQDSVLVGALDDRAEEIASALSCQSMRFEGHPSHRLAKESLVYRRAGWKPVVFSKLSFVRRLLETGRHVLFSDADVVFLKNPLPFFPGENRADFAAQSDALDDASGDAPRSLCSGLYYAHPTREAIEALSFTPEDLEQHGGDQDYLRKKLGIERAARCSMLPRNLFPNGHLWKHRPPSDPVAVHFNWIEGVEAKRKWMEDCGMWCLDDTSVLSKFPLPMQANQ